MDPCPFVRLTVGNLALKSPVAAKPARTAVHPSSSPCFCRIKLKNFPIQSAAVPYIPLGTSNFPDGNAQPPAATFHLAKSDLDKLTGKSSLFSTSKKPQLKISVYSGRRGATCGVNSGRLLGKITVALDLAAAESRAAVFHNGWITVGKETKNAAQFHLNVRAEPDPRFVFQFDGAPECSPQVFQIRGNIRQPVFTCKFSLRAADRNQRSRSLPSEASCSGARGWLSSFGSERERPGKERKGWSITIHDLSGSPVAVASMVTPFVASPGSDRVSRSNPGCWLILRPGDGTWKPWGRLEAWRERGSADGLGYRFELIPDSAAAAGIVLADSTLSCSKGGKFVIDLNGNGVGSNASTPRSTATSPGCSPRSSGDFGYGLWPYCMYRGFVMAASVEGEGGSGKMAPLVEVGVQQVNCTEDAAAFVALSAALDLSMDACRLFSHKLRKELCPPQDILLF
ncbi:formin-like protein [Perilla frutescens var. hirtella]|uniref:Formin-like protein n=1 Tax=Perilla frutescens var. hirtella TaxID=608512 RepID=A0AAD4JLY1_PERFH|nr:formin-like protein [Perilla frutescens var. hirtella]